jgi:hypothetical protein
MTLWMQEITIAAYWHLASLSLPASCAVYQPLFSQFTGDCSVSMGILLDRSKMVRATLSLALCGFVASAEAFGPAARSILHSTLVERNQLNAEYDYVIVGGGTAGLTVADRLTESGQYSVLVIEIGVFRRSDQCFAAIREVLLLTGDPL